METDNKQMTPMTTNLICRFPNRQRGRHIVKETDMIIYMAKNKINNKIYIGQTIKSLNSRFKSHLRGKTYFDNSLRKYGINNFEINIIDSASTIQELNQKEEFWIKKYNSIVPNGYNILYGGKNSKGHHRSESTKYKLRIANLGKKHTKLSKEKMSVALKELWKNENYKQKMKKRKSVFIEGNQYGKANKGKLKGPMGSEQKLKISIKCKELAKKRKRDKLGHFIKNDDLI